MKILLLLMLLVSFVLPIQNQDPTPESAPMSVLSFKWTRGKRAVTATDSSVTPPAQAMIGANKNFARNARINDPAGVRDPNADTLDGRRDALEKSVQDSRTAQAKPQEGFVYKVKIQNASSKLIEIVFWEYQFVDASDSKLATRRQFLCGVSIPAEKSKELEGFSLSGPSDVVSLGALGNKPEKAFQENVRINRVEFADGSIWQRKDWSLHDVKLSYERALREPWSPGMCKPL